MKKVTSPLKYGNWTITIDVNKLNTEFLARHNRITDLTISACASNNPKLRLRWRLTLRKLKRDLDKSAHVEKIKGDKFWTLVTEENRQEINKAMLEISQGEPPEWFKERMKTTQEEKEAADHFSKYMDELRASDAPMGSHQELQDFMKKLDE